MASQLEIHPASHDERVAAHRNVFDIWSKGRSLEDHVRHRLNSPTHRRAEWFVGCLDGAVVVSLAGHRVRFRVGSDELPGIAIGSVYTVGEARGRGYAPQLIAWVERFMRERETGLSVLYSDIKPDYYARQGYLLCPSWEGWRELGDAAPCAASHRLVEFAVSDQLPAVEKLYAGYHGAMPLSIARDDDYWTMMLEKFAADTFYALQSPAGEWAGYALVGKANGAWRLIDFALADQTETLAEELYAALVTEARAGKAERVGGWMPDSVAARKLFTLSPRRTEITMVKPLAWRGVLTPTMVAGTGRFCELDHV